MLEPQIPSIETYLQSEELEKKRYRLIVLIKYRTIFKTFYFYIPFLQLFRLSKNYKSYSELPIY